MRRFFAGVGLVLLVVCGIIFAITFIERLPQNPGAFAAIADAWTRLLEYMPLFIPLAVFMGTLLASYNLIRSSESIIISAAGMSPYQSARPFLIGAFLMGVFITTVVNPYSVNLSSKNISADQLNLIDDEIWLRENSADNIITLRAKNMRADDNALYFQTATVFTQSPDSKLSNRVEADQIKLSDNGLTTDNAKIWNNRGVMSHGKWEIKTLINPQTVLDRYLQPAQISFWQLPTFIKKMENIGAPVRGHLVQFWTLLFMPLTLLAMTTLGVAFSQTRQRRNFSFGVKFGIGIITCFALYFIVNMMGALGATGALPAILAVIAPPLIIIAGAGVFITTYDTV